MSLQTSGTAAPPKVYGVLDENEFEIRVLVIEQGEIQDALKCHLKVISLADGRAADYETLSYCWGDASVRGTVVIDHILVDVPASSEAALRAARSVDHAKSVWIDALCINQSDMTEKGDQISRMDRVYQRGQRNNIYLGDDYASVAEEDFHALQHLATQIRQDAPESSDYEREEWTLRGYLPRAWVLSNSMSPEDKNRMQRVLHLPWFKLWTMQEFALAESNVCIWGSAQIDFNDIVVAASFYIASLRSSPGDFDMEAGRRAAAVHSFTRLAQEARQTAGPLDFDLRTRYEIITSRSASDPRDYVFGLVGLLKSWKNWNVLPDLLHPDYRKTEQQVFRDATRAVLEMDGDALLEHVRFESDTAMASFNMPTWAVRWDTPSGKSLSSPSGNVVALPPESNAGNGMDSKEGVNLKRTIVDPDVLEVKGFFLDAVSWVSIPVERVKSELAAGSYRSMDALIEEIVQRAASVEDNFFQLSQAEMAMLVLSGDRWDYGPHAFRALQGAVDTYANLKVFIEKHGRIPTADDGDDLATGLRLYNMLQTHSRAISLSNGRVGLGPQISRVGDRLFIMDGGIFPYVLRACDHDWQIVGAALVHRLMHGEVYNMGIEAEWIRLR